MLWTGVKKENEDVRTKILKIKLLFSTKYKYEETKN